VVDEPGKENSLFFSQITSLFAMPPKHKKHDRVMVLATRFFDEGSEDRNGDVFFSRPRSRWAWTMRPWHRHTLHGTTRGAHVVFEEQDPEGEKTGVCAVGWNDHRHKALVTNCGSVTPGKPANKKRQRAEDGRNYHMPVPRPSHLEHCCEINRCVDRHNRRRQSMLKLHKTWKTKRWDTRVQTEVLGTSMVDAHLTCRWLMPKWRDREDCESNLLAFVNEVVLQVDGRVTPDSLCSVQ
jgi:hypothetical protein